MDEKLFAIGDIHGCYRELMALMGRLPWDKERDILVFLGDYINRGPQSREVLDYLVTLRDRCPRTIFLLGNHEHMLLSYAVTGDVEKLRLLRTMGVEATLKSYGDASVRSLLDLSFLPAEHLAFLQSLKESFRWDRYLFVHADTQINGDDSRQLEERLTSRRLAREHARLDDCVVVFGHTAFRSPLVTPERIGIDTGVHLGNTLTALELPRMRFYHS
jgi:serine/threonine protein phosphatase 1